MKIKILILSGLLGLVSLACAATANLPFSKPTPTPTSSPTVTLTPLPSQTPTPTITPTPQPGARIASGDQALLNGDWETAQKEFETAQQASDAPEIHAAARLGLGRTFWLAGEYQLAVDTLTELIQANPDPAILPRAYFTLAQAYTVLENYPQAVQAYTNYLSLNPGVIDAYILDLRGDANFAAGEYTAAAQDYLAALQPDSLLEKISLDMKRARSYALAGDHVSALALYDDLTNRTTNESTRALIQLRKGQSFSALGQPAEASAAYLEAVNNFPTAYETYLALLEIVEAGTPVSDLNRGLVDYYAGEYGVALAAFNRYLQNNPADPGTALYFNGMTNRALGEYDLAVEQWDELIQNYPEHLYWDKAWDQKAYTQWYFMEQYPEAVTTLLNFAEQYPSHPRSAEFLFDAAQVAERSGELSQAAELWERVINLYPGYEQADRALFLSGIAKYRQEDYSGAFLAFERLLGLASDSSSRAVAHFWIGKTQEKMGDPAQARASWELAANADPTGYYSERALDLLYGKQPFSPPLAYDLGYDYAAERAKAETWLRTIFLLPENTDLTGLGGLVYHPLMVRGNELWELGLYEEARAEFEALRTELRSDAVGSFLLADHLAKIGLYRSATLAAREVLNLAGMDDAETMNAPAFFNRLRFGTYFKDLIIPAAERNGFHPLLIFSLIRQESLFESFVRSSAAASGLMQIIPATGNEIAKNLGWPPDYANQDLSRPLVNVTFGVDYLKTQLEAFDGDIYAALAAYNGGPGNASQWLKLADGDPDLFLETIRYSETRDYLRRIYEIFNIYRRLYGRSP